MDRGVCYSTIQLGKRQKKNCRKSRRTSFFPSLKQDDIVGKKRNAAKGLFDRPATPAICVWHIREHFPFFPALDTTIHKLSTGILVTDYTYKWLGHIKPTLLVFNVYLPILENYVRRMAFYYLESPKRLSKIFLKKKKIEHLRFLGHFWACRVSSLRSLILLGILVKIISQSWDTLYVCL